MTQEEQGVRRVWIRQREILALVYMYPTRWLSHLFPVRFLCWLSERMGPVFAGWLGGMAGNIEKNMVSCFEGHSPPRAPEQMARTCVARDLRRKVDDLVMRRLDMDELHDRTTVHGLKYLDDALADGNGVIVVSGHFLSNRLAKFYLRWLGYSLMSTRRHGLDGTLWSFTGIHCVAPASNRFLATIIEDEVQLPDAGLGAKLLRRLRENGLVNFHVDVRVETESYPFSFFNWVHDFPAGFLRLAELTGAPVVAMLCTGNSSKLHIRFEKPARFKGRSSPDVFLARLEGYAKLVETWISTYPEEWDHWRYFKRHEDGAGK